MVQEVKEFLPRRLTANANPLMGWVTAVGIEPTYLHAHPGVFATSDPACWVAEHNLDRQMDQASVELASLAVRTSRRSTHQSTSVFH